MTGKILDTRELIYIRGGSRTIRLGPKAEYCKTLVKKTTMPVATPLSVSRTRDRKLTQNSYIEHNTRVGGETKCSQDVEIHP